MSDDWGEKAKIYHLIEWANRQDFIQVIIDELDLHETDIVLDVGAGTGLVSIALAPMVRSVYALDKSQAMLDKIPPCHNIFPELGDVTAMHFLSDTFDKIVMRQVLHLVDDPDRALRECYRVLRYGGRMVLCEGIPPHPNLTNWFSEMLLMTKNRYFFSVQNMIAMMMAAGFRNLHQIIHIEPQVNIDDWLMYSQVDLETRYRVLKMHHELDNEGKRHYNMTITDATRCDFHFAIITGRKNASLRGNK